jgi:hypothetical protein
MLIAEDLLLLLLDGDEGRPVVDSTATDHALAGAVLTELVELGHVTEVEPSRWSDAPRLVRRDGAVVGDELLADRLGRLDRPRTGSATVQRLATGLRRRLLERLVASGHVREERRRVLGLFPVARFPETDPGHEAQVRTGLAEVLGGDRSPGPREVALLALVDAVKALRKVLPDETSGLDDGTLAARVEAVVEDDALPVAVRKAVADARAAVDAAVMTAVIGGAAAAGST